MKKVLFALFFATFSSWCNAQTINIHLKNGEIVKYEADKVDYVDFSEKDANSSDPQDPSDPNGQTDDPSNYDITKYVSASFTGGSYSKRNDLITSGSQLYWTLYNKSKYSIVLSGLQLIDGVNGTVSSNLLQQNVTVEAGKSVSYSITVGNKGVSKPSVRFSYIFDGKVYATEAAFKEFDFPF